MKEIRFHGGEDRVQYWRHGMLAIACVREANALQFPNVRLLRGAAHRWWLLLESMIKPSVKRLRFIIPIVW